MPVRPLVRHDTAASVCFTTDRGLPYTIGGEPRAPGSATIDARPIGGDVRIDYLEPQPRSWWSFAPTAMGRMGAGRPLSGTTIAILVLLLSTCAAGLGCAALLRGRP